MMPNDDDTPEKEPEFEAFTDLTRKLLEVTKEDLDRARAAEAGEPDPDTTQTGAY